MVTLIIADYKIIGVRNIQPCLGDPLYPEHISANLEKGKHTKRASTIMDFRQRIVERAKKEYEQRVRVFRRSLPDIPERIPLNFLETIIQKKSEETSNIDVFYEVERLPEYNEFEGAEAHDAVLRAINRVCRNYQKGLQILRVSYLESSET